MSFSRSLDEMPRSQGSPTERLREALELYDEGVSLQRQNFRRRHPEATDAEIDALLRRWLLREDDA